MSRSLGVCTSVLFRYSRLYGLPAILISRLMLLECFSCAPWLRWRLQVVTSSFDVSFKVFHGQLLIAMCCLMLGTRTIVSHRFLHNRLLVVLRTFMLFAQVQKRFYHTFTPTPPPLLRWLHLWPLFRMKSFICIVYPNLSRALFGLAALLFRKHRPASCLKSA